MDRAAANLLQNRFARLDKTQRFNPEGVVLPGFSCSEPLRLEALRRARVHGTEHGLNPLPWMSRQWSSSVKENRGAEHPERIEALRSAGPTPALEASKSAA